MQECDTCWVAWNQWIGRVLCDIDAAKLFWHCLKGKCGELHFNNFWFRMAHKKKLENIFFVNMFMLVRHGSDFPIAKKGWRADRNLVQPHALLSHCQQTRLRLETHRSMPGVCARLTIWFQLCCQTDLWLESFLLTDFCLKPDSSVPLRQCAGFVSTIPCANIFFLYFVGFYHKIGDGFCRKNIATKYLEGPCKVP